MCKANASHSMHCFFTSQCSLLSSYTQVRKLFPLGIFSRSRNLLYLLASTDPLWLFGLPCRQNRPFKLLCTILSRLKVSRRMSLYMHMPAKSSRRGTGQSGVQVLISLYCSCWEQWKHPKANIVSVFSDLLDEKKFLSECHLSLRGQLALFSLLRWQE